MSVICCSWNSLGAAWVIRFSSRSKLASTPLKSKRVVNSRLAWSTALVSSWVYTSDTISKEGMAMTAMEDGQGRLAHVRNRRSEEHTSELQSLMRISYAVFCLKKQYTIINLLAE